MKMNPALPQTHRALVVTSTNEPLTIQNLPTPTPGPGSAVVRVLAASVISYMSDIYNGTRRYPFPTPLVPGTSAVARVAAVGPDATILEPGMLVLVDCVVRGRDDPTAAIDSGIHQGWTARSAKLMLGEWRDSTYAEYAKVPLEACALLDERRLCGGLGYQFVDLTYTSLMMVPHGGLRDINLRPGETVIVSPATGHFGGAAVLVALAMGARVIAMGRNKDKLAKIKMRSERIETVPITGDVENDLQALKSFGTVDAFFDISPPQAGKSTHFKSGILALRHGGRVSLMGGCKDDLALPHFPIMHSNLTLKGKWMYEREDIVAMLKLVETGVLKLGAAGDAWPAGVFGLEDWSKAFTAAGEKTGMGEFVVIAP